MANEQQVPRLLHQLVRRAHIGITTQCRQCFWEDKRITTSNKMCEQCPEKPLLCSTICFERYHQRMHPQLYPSIIPIFSASALRTREGQWRGPSRFQPGLELHQLTHLDRGLEEIPHSRPHSRHQRRCRQCYHEARWRTETRLMCGKCPGRPSLCSAGCFQRYHQYQARQPRLTLDAAIRQTQGSPFVQRRPQGEAIWLRQGEANIPRVEIDVPEIDSD